MSYVRFAGIYDCSTVVPHLPLRMQTPPLTEGLAKNQVVTSSHLPLNSVIFLDDRMCIHS